MAAKVSEALANEKQPKARDWLLKSGFNSSKVQTKVDFFESSWWIGFRFEPLEVVGPWTFGVDGDVGLAEVEDCSTGGPGAIRKKVLKLDLKITLIYHQLALHHLDKYGLNWARVYNVLQFFLNVFSFKKPSIIKIMMYPYIS